jgi:hypothetical protein
MQSLMMQQAVAARVSFRAPAAKKALSARCALPHALPFAVFPAFAAGAAAQRRRPRTQRSASELPPLAPAACVPRAACAPGCRCRCANE